MSLNKERILANPIYASVPPKTLPPPDHILMGPIELAQIVVKARTECIKRYGAEEDDATVNLLMAAFGILADQAGMSESEVHEYQAPIDMALQAQEKTDSADDKMYDTNHGAHEQPQLSQNNSLEMQFGFFNAAVGLDDSEQNILLETAIFIARFYGAWQPEVLINVADEQK